MLNQAKTEAQLSANYVGNYLDCVEDLPNDLQRHLSRLRELDVSYRECVRDVQAQFLLCGGANPHEYTLSRASVHLQAILLRAQEIGDEKLQEVQMIQDLIDNKQRSLDTDHKKLISCLEVYTNGNAKKEPTPPSDTINEKDSGSPQIREHHVPTPPTERTVEKEKDKGEQDKPGGERWSKRTRGTRNKTSTITDGAESSERGVGKKKKPKAHQVAQRLETPSEEVDAIDPDEPRYCLCDQISFGAMILCDNHLCPIEWFHFSCVSLTTKPKGKWFCPKCRGDRPNVRKPKNQFLKELERYNKEKEEKA
ncbi:inhibitor of growth protein 1-like isoform X2 [Hyposmocoma kahamanoa]|uniref:inhibitor of growth protein 1-like isoform X2 n=1 Tax=Hyposmocoma kahamanoa TaxID=1477025 RepID=UPI000E6D71DB|nr:inhibitor of growth protein 1-like isoform X2 [Hyposmocoma kahamanoa]